jgi:hypothetical protein
MDKIFVEKCSRVWDATTRLCWRKIDLNPNADPDYLGLGLHITDPYLSVEPLPNK